MSVGGEYWDICVKPTFVPTSDICKGGKAVFFEYEFVREFLLILSSIYLFLAGPYYEYGDVELTQVPKQINMFCGKVPIHEARFPAYSRPDIIVNPNRNTDANSPISGTASAATTYLADNKEFQVCVYIVGGLLPGQPTPRVSYFIFQRNLHLRSNGAMYGGTIPLQTIGRGIECVNWDLPISVSQFVTSVVMWPADSSF